MRLRCLLSFVLSFFLVTSFVLVGCGTEQPPPEPAPEPTPVVEEVVPTPVSPTPTAEPARDPGVEGVDLAGVWTGTLTFTSVDIVEDIEIPNPFDEDEPPMVITREDCEEMIEIGVPMPFGMQFDPSTADSGSVTFVWVEDEEEEEEEEHEDFDDEQEWLDYTYRNGRVRIDETQEGIRMTLDGRIDSTPTEDTLEGPLTIVIRDDDKVIATIEGDVQVAKPR